MIETNFRIVQILFDGAVVYGFMRVNRLICEALGNHKRKIEELYDLLAKKDIAETDNKK